MTALHDRNSQLHDRNSQAGSAYIIALLVLVVLSILGLSLALVSQTEMQIGANDLTTHRAFYGSESGKNQALSRMLTVNSSVAGVSMSDEACGQPLCGLIETVKFLVPERRMTLNYTDPNNPVPIVDTQQATKFGAHVEISPFMPIRDVPCDLCPAGEGDVQFVNVNHAVVATSGRVVWTGVGAMPTSKAELDAMPRTARKQLYLQVGVQPWWQPRWESIADELQGNKVLQETLGAQ